MRVEDKQMINREDEIELQRIFNPLNMQPIAAQCKNASGDFYKVASDKIVEVYKNIVPVNMNNTDDTEKKLSLTELDYDLLDKYVSDNNFKTYLIDGLLNRGVGVTISIKVENGSLIDTFYTDSVYVSATKNIFIRNDFKNLKHVVISLDMPENQEWVSAKFDSNGILNAMYFGKSFECESAKPILSTYKQLTPYKIDEIIKILPQKKSGIIFKSDLNRNINAIYVRVVDEVINNIELEV